MSLMSNIMNVALISENLIKNNSPISNDVDGKYILPAIQSATDIDLQPIIGSKLLMAYKCAIFEGYMTQSKIDSCEEPLKTVLNSAKIFLDDYIVKYLQWQVMVNLTTMLNYKYANGGVYTNQDEKRIGTDYKTNMQLIQQYQKYANGYAISMKEYQSKHQSVLNQFVDAINGLFNIFDGTECDCKEDIPYCGIIF